MHIELAAILVDDYDEAIAFYTDVLGFELDEDSSATTDDGRPKRWVVVRPPGAATGLLLARADGDQQRQAVGTQFAGRVGMFLRVDDFDATHDHMERCGVEFVTEPRDEPYGRVAVFRDIAGNRWDLLGPVPSVTDANEWDEVAAGWDADPIVNRYAQAAHASLIDILDARGRTLDHADVLDFGCGTGLLTERLATVARRVDAVDSSPAMLDVLRRKSDRLGWSNVRTLADVPTGSGLYDLVVASSVCGFLDDYPAAVRELTARLRPGGLLVHWDWERDDTAGDDHGLARAEVTDALVGAGCVDVEVRTAFSVAVDDAMMAPLVGVGALADVQ